MSATKKPSRGDLSPPRLRDSDVLLALVSLARVDHPIHGGYRNRNTNESIDRELAVEDMHDMLSLFAACPGSESCSAVSLAAHWHGLNESSETAHPYRDSDWVDLLEIVARSAAAVTDNARTKLGNWMEAVETIPSLASTEGDEPIARWRLALAAAAVVHRDKREAGRALRSRTRRRGRVPRR